MGISFVEESKNMSDNEIISRINEGRYEYLQVLIDRYMPLILSKAKAFGGFGIEIDDLIAEGIMGVFSAVKSFDTEKSKFSTFVSLCIERAMLAEIRTASRKRQIPSNMITYINDLELESGDNPEDIYINKESFCSLKENIVSGLSDMENKVFELFLDGNSYSDIAEKLGVSVKSVDNSLSRIRNKIKKQQ